ncbi:hypothetical protein [Leptolyngbya sp. FACHB-711]|uniref:hypothetical protein n=1 Tax=unclassified Leptolyngbya TaxID=2650499 RepID=UPI001681FC14|nr:hypothetical protein [Leptolyngbya sp. FACHB-711]MBD1853450.1 hypothetical protein [Cyanobacteria bacterium FACHB-502]MBD2025453.1 hypothetical protein [Leptolyngbya sp. FACHB-711]
MAQAPNRKVKSEWKETIAKTLDVTTYQVERLLNQYNADRLCETSGVERGGKEYHCIL